MEIGIYVDESVAKDLLEQYPADIEVVQTDRLDGVSGELLVIVSLVGLTIKQILGIVKTIIKRKKPIKASIDGNEYKNIDEETLVQLIKKEKEKEEARKKKKKKEKKRNSQVCRPN